MREPGNSTCWQRGGQERPRYGAIWKCLVALNPARLAFSSEHYPLGPQGRPWQHCLWGQGEGLPR